MTLGIATCRTLIGMQAYTGCDSMSAFAGKGKTSSLRLFSNNTKVQEIIAQLEQTWDLLTNLIDMLDAFMCLLYAPKSSSTTVNRLWYDLFCTS